MVKLLVSHGADVNVKNEEGESLLSLARASGLEEIVELLSKQEAKGNKE